jgi:hypothetical protein
MFSVMCLKLVVGVDLCVVSHSSLTYQEASVIMRSILFCKVCILLMFVLDEEPQMEQPYVQISLIITCYFNCFCFFFKLRASLFSMSTIHCTMINYG